ncbi:MAG TPA: hypothetical protein VNA87_06600 [Actinomycetota bacterium]|nr:hypothetical protein [Actinomycetota bacterium]
MIRLIRYQLADYSRSRSSFPPVVISAVAIAIIYATRPVGVLTSYGATAVVVFVVSAVIAQTMSSSESPVQKEITACHAGSTTKALAGQILACVVVTLLLTLGFVLLPLLAGVFDRDPRPADVVVGLVAHLIAGTYGIVSGSITNRNVVKDRGMAWCGATVLIALGFAEATFARAPALYGRIVASILPRGLRLGADVAKQGNSASLQALLPFVVHATILGGIYWVIYLRLAKKRA